MTKSDGMFARTRTTIRKIPRCKVATYGDVAYAAGFPGAARQVVWALHSSGGLLPWQRVIGAGGKILLAGVKGAEQRLLLQTEGVAFIGLRGHEAAPLRLADVPEDQKKTTEGAEDAEGMTTRGAAQCQLPYLSTNSPSSS